MTANQAKRRFEPRIRKFLGRCAEEMEYRGYTEVSPVFTAHDDEYRWEVCGKFRGVFVGISLTICEEVVREGEGKGLAFLLDVVEEGGKMLGSLCPGNYTNDLWAQDYAGLETRWNIIEDALLEWADPEVAA